MHMAAWTDVIREAGVNFSYLTSVQTVPGCGYSLSEARYIICMGSGSFSPVIRQALTCSCKHGKASFQESSQKSKGRGPAYNWPLRTKRRGNNFKFD